MSKTTEAVYCQQILMQMTKHSQLEGLWMIGCKLLLSTKANRGRIQLRKVNGNTQAPIIGDVQVCLGKGREIKDSA